MKKVLLGLCLISILLLTSCDFGNGRDVDEIIEYPIYTMEFNPLFDVVYHIGAEVPDWEDGLVLKMDGNIIPSLSGNADDSGVYMNTVGEYQVRYFYKDPETYEDISMYIDISIIERDTFIKRFDVVYYDSFYDYIVLDDGYLGYGYTTSSDNNRYNALIVRLDSDFNVLWSHNIGTDSDEYPVDIIVVDDLYYVSLIKDVMGEDFSTILVLDVQFLILDDLGNIVHNTTYSRIGNDIMPAFTPTSDGGLISVGTYIDEYVDDNPYNDKMFAWILKYDDELNIEFDVLFNFSEWDYLKGVFERVDGNYLVWGDVRVAEIGAEGYIAIIDNAGAVTKSISLEDEFDGLTTNILTIKEDDLGNIYVFGTLRAFPTTPNSGIYSPDLFVLKYDSNLVFIDSFLIETDDIEVLQRVEVLENGNFLITGINSTTNYNYYKLFLLELDDELAIVNYNVTDYSISEVVNFSEFSGSEYVISIKNAVGDIYHLLFDEDLVLNADITFTNNVIGKVIKLPDGTFMFLATCGKGSDEFDLAAINGTDGIVIEFTFE